jgi:hypothetical protein
MKCRYCPEAVDVASAVTVDLAPCSSGPGVAGYAHPMCHRRAEPPPVRCLHCSRTVPPAHAVTAVAVETVSGPGYVRHACRRCADIRGLTRHPAPAEPHPVPTPGT